MDNILEVAENNVIVAEKKEWSRPLFEVISKDIIKSGLSPGSEGASIGYISS